MPNKNFNIKGKPVMIAAGAIALIVLGTVAVTAISRNTSGKDESVTISLDEKKLKNTENTSEVSTATTTVEITLDDCAVPVGTKLQATAIVTPENTDNALVWSTDHPEILSVSADGIVEVKGTGNAVLTATVGTVSDAVVIEGISSIQAGSAGNLPIYTGSSLRGTTSGGQNGNTSGGSNASGGSSNGYNTPDGGSSGGTSDTDPGQGGSDNGSDNGNSDNGNSDNGGNNGGGNGGGSNGGNSDNSGKTGNTSTQIAGLLPGLGFTQRESNVYVCEDQDTYYGEIITQPNVTIIYIKQRTSFFDSKIQSVLSSLLPEESGQVWNNYLSAATDRTFTAQGRRVRIVVAMNGGHSQIVIYN